jgi:circadian clock protein KaiC
MTSNQPAPAPSGPSRFQTRVPGLDRVLNGGLLVGDTYLITGAPGTGKTTLGNQLAFTHAAAGGTVVFATLMTEAHDRMLAHMQYFEFFDHAQVGDRIHYISLMARIQEGDFDGTLRLLVDMLRDVEATLLVIDGAGMARMFTDSTVEYLRFIHGLNLRAAAFGCTTVLLASDRNEEAVATHVDGVLKLSNVITPLTSARDARWLRVVKLRGSNYLNGQHRFAIGAGGITVFPRLEAAHADLTPAWPEPDVRLKFGIPGLDAMLGGGLQEGSATLVLGNPGVGKTLLGLHFLAGGARSGEQGLFAGFHETPPALASTAEKAGMVLGAHLESGLIRTMWRPPLELAPDEWAWQLLAAVEEHRPRRLVIDGYSDLIPLFSIPERRSFFAPALTNRLRDFNVTTLIIHEIDTFGGSALTVPVQNLSATMDNGILLRTVELRSSLRRMLSVLKQRQTAFDSKIREFTIGPDGIVIGDPFDATGLLTGDSRPLQDAR